MTFRRDTPPGRESIVVVVAFGVVRIFVFSGRCLQLCCPYSHAHVLLLCSLHYARPRPEGLDAVEGVVPLANMDQVDLHSLAPTVP